MLALLGGVLTVNEFYAILLVVVATFIGAFGSLFLKKGANNLHRTLSSIIKNKNLYFAVFLYGISTIVYIWALSNGDLSLIYPITSLTYVWISLVSVRFLGEKMNNFKWLGIIFIILGVFLIAK